MIKINHLNTTNKILITGVAGFIGFHLASELMKSGKFQIIGIDNLNDYYNRKLKLDRLRQLGLDVPGDSKINQSCSNSNIEFHHLSIEDYSSLHTIMQNSKPEIVIHLAAQAGVRYSIVNPHAYAQSNLVGFLNMQEVCRTFPVQHFIYASSSSVYGMNEKVPYSETDPVERPISIYAATKRANELMAFTYSHLYKVPATGLRFFTVYGPWGRPDMAYFSFTEKIIKGEEIQVYGNGIPQRDFTYVDDIVAGIINLMDKPPLGETPARVLNIGNNNPVPLGEFISTIEKVIGKTANKKMVDMQAGDVLKTFADVYAIEQLTGFKPNTSLIDGLTKFWNWYKDYYKVNV
jgi:UDP-glucuronate 4-epimerase